MYIFMCIYNCHAHVYTQYSFLTVWFLTVRPHSLANSLAALTKCHLRTHHLSHKGDTQVTILLAGKLWLFAHACLANALQRLSSALTNKFRTHQLRTQHCALTKIETVRNEYWVYIYIYMAACQSIWSPRRKKHAVRKQGMPTRYAD